jgi:hypothetical protein
MDNASIGQRSSINIFTCGLLKMERSYDKDLASGLVFTTNSVHIKPLTI